MKRSQFEWWEEALIALGIWVAMVLEGVWFRTRPPFASRKRPP